MRKKLILLTFVLLATSLQAQTIRDEINRNIHLSAGSNMAYPHPAQLKLTPAPEGKKPFYISHFGRYGSCYLSKADTYEMPHKLLASADSLGKLTSLGHEVLMRLDKICQGAHERWGELTELGASQQRNIIRRMVERFPDVFADRADIDARSTTNNACILSMEYAMMQLSKMQLSVKIHHNTTRRDMNYLNRLDQLKMDSVSQVAFNTFSRKYENSDRLARMLFNDMAFIRQSVNVRQLNDCLFQLASNIQDTELRNRLTLYDLFTDEELYDYWTKENVRWYVSGGACAVNGGKQPYSQGNLLHKIIEQADSSLQQKRPSANLRWGQEASLLPLICLLDINGYGVATDNLESLDRRGWCDYKLFPMSGNVQMVFYRNGLEDDDVLVKVLLNENEATLPVYSDNEPYYHWRDVREYYLKKLRNVKM